ncbi:MAG TPA: hypothetical protein VGO93_20815 [Candidatus Xenobia bacterium]
MSKAQQANPNIKTTVINNTNIDYRNQVTNINSYSNTQFGGHNDWGGGWGGHDWGHPGWGFYGDCDRFGAAGAFFAGFTAGALLTDAWIDTPVYVCSPVTGCVVGTVPVPEGGAYADAGAAQASVLNVLANPAQDPNDPNFDPTAGLYPAKGFFVEHPDTSVKIGTGAAAFNTLNQGGGLYYHPPNGDWEVINNFNDLSPYLYTQQANQ